jgi:VCBS repeat-containing protein
MRTRRLIATLAASAVGWAGLTLVVATPEAGAAAASAGEATRDAPHDPATYYAGTEGLTGTALALKLNEIIDGHTRVTYSPGVWDAMVVLDRDPNDPTKIIDVYSGDSLDAGNRCGNTCPNADSWNREHTWPQSRGSFNTAAGPGTDLFHMRPSRATSNSSRGNKDYDNGGAASVPGCPVLCHADGDSFEPRNAVKGDIARGIMYMDVRYNGDADDQFAVDLKMWNQVGDSGSQLGKLSTLVAWSLADPPDDAERLRNNLIDADYQHNRNPFIDHPEWVCSIWGSSAPAGACVVQPNQPPTTAPMAKTTDEDTATTVALTATDPDGDALTWSVTTPAAHGTTSITGGSTLSYTPATNFHGQDTVGVTVSDGKGGTAATTVTITVTPVNDAPVATPQSASTPAGTPTVITLAGTDVDGDTLTYAIGTQPSHGSVVLAGAQATYTPTTGYSGPDSFTFTANDGTVTSAPATVSITVAGAGGNHVPVANAQDGVTTPEDAVKAITLTGTDEDDDDILTYAKGLDPDHGTLTVTTGGQATYTPAANYHGPDSFTFTVSDGTATSAAATVSLTVTPVNDAPTVSDVVLSTTAGTPVSTVLAPVDVDGDTVTVTSSSTPAHGTVTHEDLTVTYAPTAKTASDSFTVTVSDGQGGTATAQIGVTTVARTAALSLSTPGATRGRAVTTTITATGPAGPKPSGPVTLTRDGVALGTAILGPDGTAAVTWTPAAAGATTLSAVYSGDDLYDVASSTSATTVDKSASALTFSGKLKKGRPGKVKVSVTTVGALPATGTITLKIGSKKRTATLKNGIATFKLRAPATTRLKATATYVGDGQYAAGSGKRTFKLK